MVARSTEGVWIDGGSKNSKEIAVQVGLSETHDPVNFVVNGVSEKCLAAYEGVTPERLTVSLGNLDSLGGKVRVDFVEGEDRVLPNHPQTLQTFDLRLEEGDSRAMVAQIINFVAEKAKETFVGYGEGTNSLAQNFNVRVVPEEVLQGAGYGCWMNSCAGGKEEV